MTDDELNSLHNPDAEDDQILNALFAHMTPRAWLFYSFAFRQSLCHAHLLTRREDELGSGHTTSNTQFAEAFQDRVAEILERAKDENRYLTVDQLTTIGRALRKEALIIRGILNSHGS